MAKNIRITGTLLFFLLCLFSLTFAEEQFTITTYYPSPYGSYNQLYVANNFGIGTTAPRAHLEVNGAVIMGGGKANLDPMGSLDDTIFGSLANSAKSVIGWNRTGGEGETDFIANRDGGGVGGFKFYDYTNAGVLNHLVTMQGGGNVGIGTANPTYQLQLSTDSAAKPTTNTWTIASDRRLKKNIKPLKGALERMLKLRGVTFQWREPQKFGNMTGTYMGLIGQEVEKLFPEWVGTDSDGYKNLTIGGFEALTSEAIKELKSENDALKKRIEKLEKLIIRKES